MSKRLSVNRLKKALENPGQLSKAIRHDVTANLAYRFTDGFSFRPELIVLGLTNRCNLKCQMCPQWGERGMSKNLSDIDIDRELSAEVLSSFIHEVAPIKPSFHLTGGETLLTRDIDEIITLLKSEGLSVSLTTNGTLLPAKADFLVDAGIDEIVVSVDGIESDHDKIRGVKGAFSRLVKGINAVNDVKIRKKKSLPAITTQTTISAANIDRLTELVGTLAKLPITHISLSHLQFTSEKQLNNHLKEFEKEFSITHDTAWVGLPQDPDINSEKLLAAIKEIGSLNISKPEVRFVPNFTAEDLVGYYNNAGYFPRGYPGKCLFPWKGLIVGPNGNVEACPNYSVGNISKESFKDIWNGPRYARFRQVLRRRKTFPLCSRCCWYYYHTFL